MGFHVDTVGRVLDRQKWRCAHCGKKLVEKNRNLGERGAWEVHHRRPLAWDGTNSLKNCVVLCINKPQQCHLKIGHGGDYKKYRKLNDGELPYLNG